MHNQAIWNVWLIYSLFAITFPKYGMIFAPFNFEILNTHNLTLTNHVLH